MLNRLRRPATLALTVLVPASLALAACGDSETELEGFDAVSVSGDVGEAPEIDWKGTLAAGEATTEVLIEGEGEAVAEGDKVLVDLEMVNGWTHETDFSTFDEDTLAVTLTVGQTEPQTALDVLTQAVTDAIEPGQKLGSRIAVTVGSDVLLGNYLGDQTVSGMAVSMDIGNEDGLLFVADLRSFLEPTGTEQEPAAWAPAVVDKDGTPVSLDFTGTRGDAGKLQVTSLVVGEGPVVESGQQIMVNYLGQVRSAKKPFDESYTGTPFTAVVGGESANVVEGWSQGLVGLPVGSRVILEIPPSLGYKNKAQKDADGKVTIPANSTLYFVVDILDAADVPSEESEDSEEGASDAPSESASE